MTDINIDEYSNSELEEMGIPLQHDCLSTYREVDDEGNVYDVCVDCGASAHAGYFRGAVQWNSL